MDQFGSGRSNGPPHPSNQDSEHNKNAVLNQMLDLFMDSVEIEAIQSVLESCEHDYERSKKALQSISLKDVSTATAVLPTTHPLSPPLPQPRHSEHQRIQHFNQKPAPSAVVNAVNKPRQSPSRPSRLVSLPSRSANQADQTLERIHKFINDGNKILVLMRGCPGSGKSFLAQELLQWRGGERSNHVFSSDDYFIKNGKYVFNPQELQNAHKAAQDNVLRAVRNSYSPVVVDNTNTQSWEMQVYVIMAVNHGYAVETLEPQTPWRFNHAQLVRRNIHNVPPNNIRAMLERYEHGLTGEDIIKQLKLNYPPSKHPPQPARRTITPSPVLAASPVTSLRSPALISPRHGNGELLRNEPWLFNENSSQPLNSYKNDQAPLLPSCALFLQLETAKESYQNVSSTCKTVSAGPSPSRAVTQLGRSTVTPLSLADHLTPSSGHSPRQSSTSPPPAIFSYPEPKTNDERSSSDAFETMPNFFDLDSDLTESKFDFIKCQPSNNKEGAAEWGNVDWEGVLKRNSNDCQTDQRTRWLSSNLNDAKASEKLEIRSEPPKSNVWNVSEASCSWNTDTMLSEEKKDLKEDLGQRKQFVSLKQDASSNTHYQDFLLISNNRSLTEVPPGMRLLTGTSRNINENVGNFVGAIRKKMVVDVSSMTDDESGSPVKGSLNELLRMFPHVSLANLETLLETCHGDVNWASNCLLDTDSGVRLDVPSLLCSESPSIEPREMVSCPKTSQAPATPQRAEGRVESNQRLNRSLSQISLDLKLEDNQSLRRCSSLPVVTSQLPTCPIAFPSAPLETIAPPTAYPPLPPPLPVLSASPQPLNKLLSENVSSETPKEKPSLYPFLPDDNEVKLLEISDESETSSQDDDDMLEFVISPEFSQQLFSRFGGPKNKFRKSGLSPVLRIPESIACQIHYYLVLSQQEYYADDNEEEEEESILDLQDKMGQELFEKMCSENPLTEQEQADMKLATEIYEMDLAALYNSSYKADCATVLARRLLKETFPTLDPYLLDELMEVHGNSYHKTKEMIQEHYMNSYTVKQKDFPALSGSQAKTSSRNRSDISDRVRLKAEADGELHIARIYKQKAKEQSAKRGWSAAAVYSQMAKAHKRRHSKNMELTVQRVLANNMQEYCPSSLDLHFLNVDEAVTTLNVFLDDHIRSLENSPNTIKSLYIITGRGKHSSGGVPKIRPAVLQHLDERELENNLENPGLVRVKVTSRSLLSCEC